MYASHPSVNLCFAAAALALAARRILSLPLLKKSAADDLRAAAALVPLLTSICAAFTWQLPAPLQTRAAEVREKGLGVTVCPWCLVPGAWCVYMIGSRQGTASSQSPPCMSR